MSRRKQSNPKPLKRPEDEDEESDTPSPNLDQSDEPKEMDDQSQSPLPSDSENEPMETENEENKRELTSPVQIKEEITDESENCYRRSENEHKGVEMSPRRLEVMNRLNFPTDLLTLRQVEEAEFLQTGIPWSVTSVSSLPKGTTIGPYQGETVALSSIKPGELVLQFQGTDGEFSFIKVTEGTGAWLSLLRPADHQANAHNTQVLFEGGRIWCEIVEELKQGTELLASFTTSEEELPPSVREKSVSKTEGPVRETKPSTAPLKKADPKSIPHITPQPALIYGCPFCCVRFSSRRTLEAHLTYYCSKKPPDFVSLQELHQQLQQQAQALLEKQTQPSDEEFVSKVRADSKDDQLSPRGIKRLSEERNRESAENSSSDCDEKRSPSVKSSETLKCQSCTFTTDRVSSLQLHQRLHSSDGSSVSESERMSVSPSCHEETFCKECKIQFSSVSTYRGHKEFYCKYGMSQKSKAEENISELASPGPKDFTNDLTLKMLKAQNIALESSSHILGAKGQLHPALLAANPMLASPLFLQDLFLKSQLQGEVNKSLTKIPAAVTSPNLHGGDISTKHGTNDQPLDLSKSKSDKDSPRSSNGDVDFAENSVKREVTTSPNHLGPAAKKIKLNDENMDQAVPTAKTPLNIPSLHSTLLLGNQIQYVNKKPIPPLQSVSRCVECNIVFYKHENYLIHKEHYCSGRHGNKDSASSDSENGEHEGKEQEPPVSSKLTSSAENDAKLKPEATVKQSDDIQPESLTRDEVCYKFFCIPCKIKFSSAGTLKAHKEFYCPHGKDSNGKGDKNSSGERSSPNSNGLSTYHCENCKNDFNSARLLKLHICMGEMAQAPLLRCLYCDYVTQTENRLSEHMKVHVPTKAFKCNICGYRGNTARGMRMHGKMHVENGEEFTDDNMIEFEEPPLVPIQKNGVCEKGPIDMETELIRMKNEPYKRRRSRKSFEKSENMVPFLGQSMLTQICAACGQTFGNVSDFVIHLRMHEIAALEAMKNLKSLQCEHCNEFVADSLTGLLVHMQTKHPEQLPGTSKSDLEGQVENERSLSRESQISNERSRSSSVESSRTNKTSSSHDKSDSSEKPRECRNGVDDVYRNHIKQESDLSNDNTNDYDNRSKDTKDLSESPKSQNSPQSVHDFRSGDHKLHDYQTTVSPTSHRPQLSPREPGKSPQPPSTPLLPVKSEPKSPPNDREHTKSLSPKFTVSHTSPDKLSPKLMSPDPKTRYLLSQNTYNMKREQSTPPRSETPKKSPPPLSPRTPVSSPKLAVPILSHSPKLTNLPLLYPHSLISPYHYPPGIPISFIPTPGLQTSPPIPASASEKIGRKYCKHCDINFTYLSSFLTHKKYYCSARSTADDSESQTATA